MRTHPSWLRLSAHVLRNTGSSKKFYWSRLLTVLRVFVSANFLKIHFDILPPHITCYACPCNRITFNKPSRKMSNQKQNNVVKPLASTDSMMTTEVKTRRRISQRRIRWKRLSGFCVIIKSVRVRGLTTSNFSWFLNVDECVKV